MKRSPFWIFLPPVWEICSAASLVFWSMYSSMRSPILSRISSTDKVLRRKSYISQQELSTSENMEKNSDKFFTVYNELILHCSILLV